VACSHRFPTPHEFYRSLNVSSPGTLNLGAVARAFSGERIPLIYMRWEAWKTGRSALSSCSAPLNAKKPSITSCAPPPATAGCSASPTFSAKATHRAQLACAWALGSKPHPKVVYDKRLRFGEGSWSSVAGKLAGTRNKGYEKRLPGHWVRPWGTRRRSLGQPLPS
jgi:hypothetical protein